MIWDSIFNRIVSQYGGGERGITYSGGGMNAAGTTAAPVPEGPGIFSRLLTSGIGLLNRGGAPTAGTPIDPTTGELINTASAGYPSINPIAAAAPTVGRTPGLMPVSNYGQLAKGLPAFAQENRAEILKRNII